MQINRLPPSQIKRAITGRVSVPKPASPSFPSYAPAPNTCRIYGDLDPARLHLPVLEGIRGLIVHTLCYYGYPQNIDDKISKLPSDEKLLSLKPFQKEYFSLFVYALKRMVGNGMINANKAWGLCHDELIGISCFSQINLIDRWDAMFEKIRMNQQSHRLSREFQFFALSGNPRAVDICAYKEWKQGFNVRGAASRAGEEIYARILWAEMRRVELEYENQSLRADVRKLEITPNLQANFNNLNRTIRAEINLFAEEKMMLGASLLAELGHWLIGLDNALVEGWLRELLDRMWAIDFTSLVFTDALHGADYLSARVFREGSFYIQALGQIVPAFPQEYVPPAGENRTDAHILAEMVERHIRNKIVELVENKTIAPEKAYELYRKIPLWLCSIAMQENAPGAVIDKINSLDVVEIHAGAKDFVANSLQRLEEETGFFAKTLANRIRRKI